MPSREPRTPLEAVTDRRFLATGWPWRSAGYLLTGIPLTAGAVLALGALAWPWGLVLLRQARGRPLSPGSAVALILLGAGLVALWPVVATALARVERLRTRMVGSPPLVSGHRAPPAPGAWPWLRTRYTEAATWRELGYALLLATAGPVVYAVVLLLALLTVSFLTAPFLVAGEMDPVSLGFTEVGGLGEALPYALAGLVLLPLLPYPIAVLAGAQAALARALLQGGPGERLRAQLVQVSRSRARLVDAFEAERRRIERDLHDGAQQRLVGLTLQIGMARLDVPPGSPAAEAMAQAHGQAKQFMAELRELIHGIHPRVLSDQGLAAAFDELADRCPVPVTVRADLPERLPAHVEGTAYFVAAEALTNIARHSGATRAALTASAPGGLLVVEISDDGRGGADPQEGTGLTGLADRVSVAGGRMLMSSPPGGPTLLRVEIPCGQNDPSE
ncbi:sensor domain-containing protein [Streptosporangium sp. NPDC020072]|uniref:histidine kinase n=1 Tax=Streptosporangium jomthongense TaxID=1193683 RepID=A0ABV8F2M3_9ACTN